MRGSGGIPPFLAFCVGVLLALKSLRVPQILAVLDADFCNGALLEKGLTVGALGGGSIEGLLLVRVFLGDSLEALLKVDGFLGGALAGLLSMDDFPGDSLASWLSVGGKEIACPFLLNTTLSPKRFSASATTSSDLP